jgi:hypothetical protein
MLPPFKFAGGRSPVGGNDRGARRGGVILLAAAGRLDQKLSTGRKP